ncbi:hypothetical protein F511_39369 [Dorcoceras hygrometricum]|uniref:Uncharacterized protein n=1 Tax=Dorcoceras hygrometricum TaxID=472368 RepID=A0A2Z7BX25_9LAMI|nr:hypothetical protein F511_39369 [Dorcoceras hygrometricum]
MSSSTESIVRSVVNAVDSAPASPETKEPWLPDQAELGSSRPPWYKEKSSTLRRAHGQGGDAEEGYSGASAPPRKVAKKRKTSTPAEKEARHQNKKGASTSGTRPASATEERRAPTLPIPTTEKRPDPTSVITIPEVSSPKRRPTTKIGRGRVPALNLFEDSLVVSPSGAVATRFLCHMVPDRDLSRLGGATDSEAVGLFTAQFASVPSWSGLCTRVEELHEEFANAELGLSARVEDLREEFANAELGLGAELVGLMYSCRRATPSVCNAELGFSAELVELMCSSRRATRGVCQYGIGLRRRAGRAFVLKWGATRGV